MATSLVVKLSESSTNTSLTKLGAITLNITPRASTSGRTNQLTVATASDAGDVALTINGSGYFTDSTRSENYGKTLTVNASTSSRDIYFSDGTYTIVIDNKYALTKFILGKINTSGSYSNISTTIEQFRGMTALTDLELEGCSVSGNAYRALHLNTALTILGLGDTYVTGDFTALQSELTSLTTHVFPTWNTDVTLNITVAAGNSNQLTLSAVNGDVVLSTTGNTYFTDAARSINSGTSKTIAAGTSETIYLPNTHNGTLIIRHAQFVSVFNVGTNMDACTFDVSQMHDMVNLTNFTWSENWDVNGNLGGLKDSTGLTYLDVHSTSVLGDISQFRYLTGLTYLDVSKSGMSGDIRHLANLSGLTTLILTACGVYGTCIALKKLTNLARLDIGDVSIYGVSYWKTNWNSTCTINGNGASSDYTYTSEDSTYASHLYTIVDNSSNILAYFDTSGNFHVSGNVYALNI